MQEHAQDKFLIIVDENLDIMQQDQTSGGIYEETVSGSGLVQTLCQRLDDATAGRMLALVRSANDSPADLQMYAERAHGFLLKEPIQKKQHVLDLIQPWWQLRSSEPTAVSQDHYFGSAHFRSSSESSVFSIGALPSSEDIHDSLAVIDLQCNHPEALHVRWRGIREHLLVLKGDLMTMGSSSSTSTTLETSTLALAIQRIDWFRGNDKVPDNFTEQWERVKSDILTCL